MINAKRKGSAGEREFAKWLKKNLELDFLPERNLDQVRSGGADILTVKPFIFEVKRCETLQLKRWWAQVVSSTYMNYHIPVVAYRQNRKKWHFLISGNFINISYSYIILEEYVFIEFAKKKVDR